MVLFSVANLVRRLRGDERGAVSVVMGVMMIPLVGALGIGFEVSNWYLKARDMQNAADSAALAAATNGGSNYDVEAMAVAAQYGFVNGTNNISVAVSKPAACPGGGNNCYNVTISAVVPLYVSQVVGYRGDATLNGGPAKQLSSLAVAKPSPQLCLLALAGSGVSQGIRTNGAPTGNMNGCNLMSNTAAQCNGHNLGAGYGFAHGTSNNCGVTPVSHVPAVTDPYAYLASTIPPLRSSGLAGNYVGNQLSGSLNLTGGNNFACGDQTLAADVIINTPPGIPAVLVVENGQLDLHGHTLTTSNGSAGTIVFSGTNGPTILHAPNRHHKRRRGQSQHRRSDLGTLVGRRH